jgi:hypothetical protein
MVFGPIPSVDQVVKTIAELEQRLNVDLRQSPRADEK